MVSTGRLTKVAIEQFQAAQKLTPATGKDGKTLLGVGGPTIQKLNAMLPATHKDLWLIEQSNTFIPALAADATAGHVAVMTVLQADATFRHKVAKAVRQVYQDYKLALTVAPQGGRRTFAEQAVIPFGKTTVGPGESNHNFGRAVDLVFRNLRWLKGDGTIVTDTPWAEQLEKQKGVAAADRIWNARDVPIKAAGLFVIAVTRTFRDRPHVQSFDPKAVNMGNALAALLNTVGTFKWANQGGSPRQYSSDLGLGATQVNVGTARARWDLQMSPLLMSAAAIGVNAAFFTTAYVLLQKALKSNFELADQHFLKWKP